MKILTHQRLIELLSYDENTGIFVWNKNVKKVKAGGVAGRITTRGYGQIGVDGGLYYAHRLAWFYVHGIWPNEEIDHINCNKSDNRLANLREATRAQNEHNKPIFRNNTSGYIGVHWHSVKEKWIANYRREGKLIHIGYFEIAEEASIAYQTAIAYRGSFAYLTTASRPLPAIA